MKRFFSIVSLVLVLIACQQKNQAGFEKEATQEQSQIKKITEFEFSEEMHNFGTLQSGEIVIFPFEFENTGKESLTIVSAETDCGCVAATFSNEPILPGESGVIEIEFDSSGLFGKQLKTIEINANTKKSKQLVIFAEIENEQLDIKY